MLRLIPRSALIALFAAMVPASSNAQVTDLLTPLGSNNKPAAKAVAKPKVAKKKSRSGRGASDDIPLMPLVSAKPAELVVTVPAGLKGATLFVDGVEAGRLPMPAREVPPGEHEVMVRRPGYGDFARRVSAAPGKSVEIHAAMEAIAGFLTVTADVEGAAIYVDGELKGVAPQSQLVLTPGSHELSVRKDGYERFTQTAVVALGREQVVAARLSPLGVARADEPRQVRLSPSARGSSEAPLAGTATRLEDEPTPLYKRWYVWAGVGAAVAVGAVFAFREGGPLNRPDPSRAPDVNQWCGGQAACATGLSTGL